MGKKKEVLVVSSKVYKIVKESGLRVGGDFITAVSDIVERSVQGSIQKVQAEGKKKTLTAADLT